MCNDGHQNGMPQDVSPEYFWGKAQRAIESIFPSGWFEQSKDHPAYRRSALCYNASVPGGIPFDVFPELGRVLMDVEVRVYN